MATTILMKSQRLARFIMKFNVNLIQTFLLFEFTEIRLDHLNWIHWFKMETLRHYPGSKHLHPKSRAKRPNLILRRAALTNNISHSMVHSRIIIKALNSGDKNKSLNFIPWFKIKSNQNWYIDCFLNTEQQEVCKEMDKSPTAVNHVKLIKVAQESAI